MLINRVVIAPSEFSVHMYPLLCVANVIDRSLYVLSLSDLYQYNELPSLLSLYI